MSAEQTGASTAGWRHDLSMIVPEAISIRRTLHERPELGLDLPDTQAVITEFLEKHDIEFVLGTKLSSVIGLIRGAKAGPTILLRADMDALPIRERTGLPFASKAPDAMHACGHDIHTASLLAAAGVLARDTSALAGNVLLMFQPGEEGHFGARDMVEEGILESPFEGVAPAERAFAMHVNPWYPTGSINLRSGPILAAADSFSVDFIGRAGHGSAPHAAHDPIPAACELVSAIQAHVARRVSAFEPTVVSVTSLTSGSLVARTVIPETATVAGTIRTLSEEGRAELHLALSRLANGIALAHDLRAEVVIERGYPVTNNDADFAADVTAALEREFPSGLVRTMPTALMGSEDFSYVLNGVPGVLAFIGTTPEELLQNGYPADNHSDTVNYDEASIEAFITAHICVVHQFIGTQVDGA